MQTIHNLLWITAFGFAQASCTSPVIVATMPDGRNDSSDGGPGTGTDDGGGANDSSNGLSDAATDTGSADGGVVVVGSCSSRADCTANQLCGFLESLACSAQGHCFASPAAVCQSYSAGCACDGSEINIACTGLPLGYVSKPLLQAGPCTDAGNSTDSGVSCAATLGGHCGGNTLTPCTCAPGLVCAAGDSGLPFGDVGGTCEPIDAGAAPATCVTRADCGSNGLCGFPSSAACMARGQCFKSPGAFCQSYVLGCACDHTAINIACTGLPGGYETKPFLHAGPCTDAGDGG